MTGQATTGGPIGIGCVGLAGVILGMVLLVQCVSDGLDKPDPAKLLTSADAPVACEIAKIYAAGRFPELERMALDPGGANVIRSQPLLRVGCAYSGGGKTVGLIVAASCKPLSDPSCMAVVAARRANGKSYVFPGFDDGEVTGLRGQSARP